MHSHRTRTTQFKPTMRYFAKSFSVFFALLVDNALARPSTTRKMNFPPELPVVATTVVDGVASASPSCSIPAERVTVNVCARGQRQIMPKYESVLLTSFARTLNRSKLSRRYSILNTFRSLLCWCFLSSFICAFLVFSLLYVVSFFPCSMFRTSMPLFTCPKYCRPGNHYGSPDNDRDSKLKR